MVTRTSPPLPLFAQDSVPLKIRQLLCFVQRNTHQPAPVILVSSPGPASDSGRPLAFHPCPQLKALEASCLCQQSGYQRRQAPARQGVSGAQPGWLFVFLVSVVTRGAARLDRVSGQHAVRVPAVPTHKTHALSTHSCSIFFHRVRI